MLQVTSYMLQVTSYNLQVSSYKLQVTSYTYLITKHYVITMMTNLKGKPIFTWKIQVRILPVELG
jgi:hypothetical protein